MAGILWPLPQATARALLLEALVLGAATVFDFVRGVRLYRRTILQAHRSDGPA